MQWFSALAEGCPGFELYADLAKVGADGAAPHKSLTAGSYEKLDQEWATLGAEIKER